MNDTLVVFNGNNKFTVIQLFFLNVFLCLFAILFCKWTALLIWNKLQMDEIWLKLTKIEE